MANKHVNTCEINVAELGLRIADSNALMRTDNTLAVNASDR